MDFPGEAADAFSGVEAFHSMTTSSETDSGTDPPEEGTLCKFLVLIQTLLANDVYVRLVVVHNDDLGHFGVEGTLDIGQKERRVAVEAERCDTICERMSNVSEDFV